MKTETKREKTDLLERYDWAVLGDHPAALLTACWAAKHGLSTLILPCGDAQRISTSESGQILDSEPNYLLGLGGPKGQFGLFLNCLSKIGIPEEDLGKIISTQVAPQVLTPGKRVGLPEFNDVFKRELLREFPEEFADELGLITALQQSDTAAADYWRRFPERLAIGYLQDVKQALRVEKHKQTDLKNRLEKLLSESRSSAARAWVHEGRKVSQLKAISKNPEFQEVASGYWYGIYSYENPDPTLFDLFQGVLLSRAAASFRGGMSQFRNYLKELALKLGAHMPESLPLEKLHLQDGKLSKISLGDDKVSVKVDGCAIGCSLDLLKDRIKIAGKKKWSLPLKTSPKATGWRFTLGMTVHKEAIAPGMSQRMVWREADAPALEIEIFEPLDFGIEEPEHQFIFLRTVLPCKPQTLDKEYQRMLAARMLRQLTNLFPFVEFHITRIFPEFRKNSSELTEAYGFTSVDQIPGHLKCLWGDGVGSRAGVDGLFFVSEESYPKSGSFGGTLASTEAISWLANKNHLSGQLF
jgi:hypothetical protein